MTILPATAEEEKSKLNVFTITWGKLSWVYIEKPTRGEIDYLAQHYSFHPLDLDDVLSRVQRPKIDEYEDYLFMVLHFPVFNKESRATTPSEVDIFISENYLVTVHCAGDMKPLSKFFKDCYIHERTRQDNMSRGSGYLLYQVLDRLVNYCFPILNKVTENLERVEDEIFRKPTPETVQEIALLRRDIISFRRIIHPQITVVESLERGKHPFLKEEQEVYFGDIADHIRRIWDGLEDCKEVVEVLTDTSNWLTSHRIQEIMRILTIAMAIMAPLTVLTGFYGMNIHLPGGVDRGSLLPFIVLLVILLAIIGVMLYFFRRRRWI